MKRRSTVYVCAAVAALVCSGINGPARAQDQGPPVNVQVATVVEQEVAAERNFVGTVRPTRTSIVGAEAVDSVVELLVREGDPVKAGQVLARQRTKTVELALDAARAEHALRTQELAELEAGTRQEDLREAEAQFEAATADRENADWQLASTKQLFEDGETSETAYRNALAAALRARAMEREAKANLEELQAGPRKERIEQARARARAQAARVGTLEDSLERHTVRAPFDGWVIAEHTEVGQWLGSGDAIVEIAALDPVDVVVSVVEDFVAGLSVGSAARVRIAAAGKAPFDGVIASIVPRADERTRTFPVKVRVPNRSNGNGPLLKAGMFAEVTLASSARVRATMVPKDALVLGGPTPMVWGVKPDGDGTGTVFPVPVQPGAADGALIAVRSDLVVGALVVVRGNERLRPGQNIAFAPPAGEGR